MACHFFSESSPLQRDMDSLKSFMFSVKFLGEDLVDLPDLASLVEDADGIL